MTAEQFLTNFGHVAMAPSGVKRLRELVLHLAVSGRIVPRKSDEGQGDVPISEAATLKQAYRVKHELRSSGSESPLAESELEFEIPSHWRWERLGNIACYIQRGKGPKYDEAGKTRVVSQKCVQWSGFNLSVARRISEDSVKDYSQERFLVAGDILWNSTGTGTAGRLALYPGAKEQVVADSHVTIIRLTNFVPAFIWCYLVSPTIQQRMIPGHERSMVTGTTNQVELSATKVYELPIPCPPLAEQKRIVTKVDELMALCNQLEAQQQERERRFPVLSRTCHARFAEATTLAHFNRIFDETGTVSPTDLRRTILNLAVQGKLVAQNAKEESAQSLLLRIRANKPNTNRVKKVKGTKNHSPLTEDDHPGTLPPSWEWARTDDICEVIVDCPHSTPKFISSGIPCLDTNGFKDGALIPSRIRYVSRETYIERTQRLIPLPGDVVFAREGSVGASVIVPEGMECCLGQRVMLFRLLSPMLPSYFQMALSEESSLTRLLSLHKGIGAKHVNVGDMRAALLPIPPVDEQKRIMARIKQLMALVDHLEAQQQQRDKLAEAFAKACVASFTGTSQLERPEIMKAPKTELVSIVTLGKKPKPGANAPLAQFLDQNKGTLPAKSLWQQSGLKIDTFYQQLKTEISQGWINQPVEAEMKILEED